MIRISRRRFLTLTGGLFVAGCTTGGAGSSDSTATAPGSTGAGPPDTGPTTSGPTSAVPTTTVATDITSVSIPPELVPDDRVLVMVELAGGNDAANTVVPLTGTYRDLRPTLAIPEPDLILPAQLVGHGLHPSLVQLTGLLDADRLAVAAGIGFPDPNRSHFVATDRWMRADRMDETLGWLGRWLDGLPEAPTALGATALGSSGAMLIGADRYGTAIDEANAFAFPTGLGNGAIRSLTEPIENDPLHAAAQRAFLTSIGAVEEFDVIADAVRRQLPVTDGSDLEPSGGAFSTGLAVAAQLVIGDVGTRVITVRGGGFDTHGDQLATHADLLADLAAGLVSFWRTIDEAGAGDRVLLATHSEFGRRIRQNASEGCDHGAAGASFLIGDSVLPGIHGSIDTTDLLDGDLRPQIDPRTMFTACLDWLGADVEQILGQRYDDVPLLA